MRILFVEDQQAFAEVVTAQFLASHEVVRASSLAEAFSAATERGPFDAVLVDHDLRDGVGPELVKVLRQRRFSGLIVATSAREEGNHALCEAGADVACPKQRFHQISAILLRATSR
jgi:DNA-binding response OmpR family regulator